MTSCPLLLFPDPSPPFITGVMIKAETDPWSGTSHSYDARRCSLFM